MNIPPFNRQDYRILKCFDVETPIHAVAQFKYKGWEISFSTAFAPFPNEVLVFKLTEAAHAANFFNTVQEAIEWCDKNKPE